MGRPLARLCADMRIAVIGTGNIGGTLGRKWSAAGHDVVYGSRGGPGEGPGGASLMAVGDAVTGADAVLLAVPGQAVAEVVSAHGAALDGKVVIDAANRIGEPVVNSREAIAAAAPQARYVRAFNTLGWENFADPPAGAVLFFAADPDARPAAEELISAVGLAPAYLGDAGASPTVDALLRVWFALVQQHNGHRRVALSVVM
jgi:8-hydroxy-5-deazaflavin:NADPH oxidoreductase